MHEFCIDAVVKPGDGDLLRHLYAVVLQIIHHFRRIIVRGQGHSPGLDKAIQIVAVHDTAQRKILGEKNMALFSAVNPGRAHLMLKSFPAVMVCAGITLGDKDGLGVPVVQQILCNHGAAAEIISPHVDVVVLRLGIGVNQDHIFVELPAQLLVFLFVQSQDDKTIHIPSGGNLCHLVRIFVLAIDQHDIISVSMGCLFYTRQKFCHKGIAQRRDAVDTAVAQHQSNDAGPFAGQLTGRCIRDIALLVQNFRNFPDHFLGNLFGVAVQHIGHCCPAYTNLICNILQTLHGCSHAPCLISRNTNGFQRNHIIFIQ